MKRLFIVLPIVFVIAAIIAIASPTPKERLIVIDAGHGGSDAGMQIGPDFYEKDLNLTIASYISKALGLSKGVRVRLTREDDVDMHLSKRAMCCDPEVALVISLHCEETTAADMGSITIHCPSGGEHMESSLLYATRIAAHLEEQGINARVMNRNRYFMTNKVDCPALLISASQGAEGDENPLWLQAEVQESLSAAIRRAVTGS